MDLSCDRYLHQISMNKRPIISILMDHDKRRLFKSMAWRYRRSMTSILAEVIDRMLEADSIDIFIDRTENDKRLGAIESSLDILHGAAGDGAVIGDEQ